MGLTTIPLNSEEEFRKYVIPNSKNISRIFVFEDVPDQTIFFYCFTKKHSIIATKEPAGKNFFYYKEIYQKLATELNLYIIPTSNQPYVLKIAQSGN